MHESVAAFVANPVGTILGVRDQHLTQHGDATFLVLAAPGIGVADLIRATGIEEVGVDIGEQGHVHSTWLSNHLDYDAHWRDREAGLMWLVKRV